MAWREVVTAAAQTLLPVLEDMDVPGLSVNVADDSPPPRGFLNGFRSRRRLKEVTAYPLSYIDDRVVAQYGQLSGVSSPNDSETVWMAGGAAAMLSMTGDGEVLIVPYALTWIKNTEWIKEYDGKNFSTVGKSISSLRTFRGYKDRKRAVASGKTPEEETPIFVHCVVYLDDGIAVSRLRDIDANKFTPEQYQRILSGIEHLFADHRARIASISAEVAGVVSQPGMSSLKDVAGLNVPRRLP